MLLRRRFYKQESAIIEDDILIFIAEQANSTIKLAKTGSPTDISIQYSTNGGSTWNTYTIGNTITLANVGDTVKFRGENSSFSSSTSNYYQFQMAGKIAASGDVTSLINGVGGDCELRGYCFYRLFYNCASLTEAPELPSLTLASYCYSYMFRGCTNLINTPKLPSKTLAPYCYNFMFASCTSLVDTTELSATTLAEGCYYSMFYSCTSLKITPELPAITLIKSCYE